MTDASRNVDHATCLGCGCACDDIRVVVQGERIVEAANACALGMEWFGDGRVPSRTLVGGRDSSSGDALGAAADLLADAANALIYLAPDLSCEAQREGVALADALGARLDSVTSAASLRPVLAAQERGRAAATLGEVRNRADLLVYWGVDPSVRYPRYRDRYAPEAATRASREGGPCEVIAVDVGPSRGPDDADRRLAIVPADEVELLIALCSAVATSPADFESRAEAASFGRRRNTSGGVDPLSAAPAGAERERRRAQIDARVRDLTPLLIAARYAVIVADAESDPLSGERDAYRSDALIALAQALNGPTRGALSLLRGGGNRSGADAVITWQTGYPVAVDFGRGYPRYRPHDGTAHASVARGDIDAVLVIGSASQIPAALVSRISGRAAVIGPRASASALAGGVAAIDTGVAGIHEGGMALRMDDVPLPLRPSIKGPPDTATIVRALCERIVTRRRHAGRSS